MDSAIDKTVKKGDTACEELTWISTNLPRRVTVALSVTDANLNDDTLTENDSFKDKHFTGWCRTEKVLNKDSDIACDAKAEIKGGNLPGDRHSIFDLKRENDGHKIVILPQLSTACETRTNKACAVSDEKHFILPSISDTSSDKVQGKRKELFDFRAREIQLTAQKRQIRRLKKQGYGTRSDSNSPSRFIARPYEGSCDDVSKFKDTSLVRRLPKVKGGGSPLSSSTEQIATKEESTNISTDSSLDETLRKIEIAYQQWGDRNSTTSQENRVRDRKRSSSHSPVRTRYHQERALVNEKEKFLNFRGNLRRAPSAKRGNVETGTLGRTYRAIASPACFRRHINRPPNTVTSVIKTSITPLVEDKQVQKKSPGLLPSRIIRNSKSTIYQTKTWQRNQIPINTNFTKETLSTSLPDLDRYNPEKATVAMNNKSHRPRTSSLNKPRTSSGKSPKFTGKQVSKPKGEIKVGKHAKDTESSTLSVASPAATRRVVVNASLPTASPTFQRAMKGMTIPEEDYSNIFIRNRRDSILQSYSIPENAQKSFYDDHDLKVKETRRDKLEEMTNKFREDVQEYKEGWNPKVIGFKQKSILKNRRRESVDDLDISTRKNLAKYLESKLDIG